MNEFISGETLNKNKHKGLHIALLDVEKVQERLTGKASLVKSDDAVPLVFGDSRIKIFKRIKSHKKKD
jgi:hypothetical protein